MSKRSDQDSLSDIHEAIQRIPSYLIEVDYSSFLKDTKTQDAVIRNLEILGEATKNLSEDFRSAHSEIPWQSMARVRDRLIHHYFGVNLDIVWQIVSKELLGISRQLPENTKKTV